MKNKDAQDRQQREDAEAEDAARDEQAEGGGPEGMRQEQGTQVPESTAERTEVAGKERPEAAEVEQDLRTKLKGAEDKYIRLLAEFDNYKRRSLREQERLIESANERLMCDLIEVRENFERALKAGRESGETGGFYEGMKLIFSRFDEILGKHGLATFGEVGEPFDPAIHDAMMKMPREDIPEDHIAQIVERGYRLRGQVIKHARVLVSAGSPDTPIATDEQKQDAATEQQSEE